MRDVEWRRGERGLSRQCGYCVPPRLIGVGELYVVFGTDRQFVRCVECATTRWGLEPPVELPADAGDAAAEEHAAAPRDWKQRAAGEE